MLSPRAIALQGAGFGVALLALQGLLPVRDSAASASVVGGTGGRHLEEQAKKRDRVREKWKEVVAQRRAAVVAAPLPAAVTALQGLGAFDDAVDRAALTRRQAEEEAFILLLLEEA